MPLTFENSSTNFLSIFSGIFLIDFYNKNPKLSFSRIPIYFDKMDNITGYVLKDNILEQIVKNNGSSPLVSIKRKSIFSNYESPIPKVFDKLIKKSE